MSEETEPEVGFFGQLKNQIITGAGAILATLGTVFIDEIKSIAGIEENQTEQVQGVQQNNQQTQQVVINIPEQKAAETKTVIIKEAAAAPVEKKDPPKKTETEKRKEEGLDW
jgi:anion-transporting  ArsA/GET3 family ATPase